MSLPITKGSKDAPLDPLLGKTIAVIGYGNQGRAHALNLRDSGLHVIVGSREQSRGWKEAQAARFEAMRIEEAVRAAHLTIIALPDEVQPQVFDEEIARSLPQGAAIGFLHGFNIRYGFIAPPANVGVIMIAPKGPGTTLRERYVQGLGIPCLFALHQDSPARDASAIAFAWANGIGCARAGIIHTTFADETETDLFGEQTVLCGGMTQLILAAFETLVQKGYPPELAYLECCHEVKQIADLVYTKGLAGMMQAISNTAEFGAYEAGPHVIDEQVRQKMREVLENVKNGSFAQRLRKDHANGFEWFEAQRTMLQHHEIERAGAVIRNLMQQTK